MNFSQKILPGFFGIAVFLLGGTYVNATSIVSEEKSLDELYQDAKAGVSDLTSKELKGWNESNAAIITPSYSSFSLSVGDETNVKTYSTAQTLESDEDSELIAVTTFNDISLSNSNFSPLNPGISLFGTGTVNDSIKDSSISVKAYSTIYYYETKTMNNIPYARLTKTTGGWTILDSSVSTSSRSVKYGTDGMPLNSQPARDATGLGLTFSLTPSPAFTFVNTNTSHTVSAFLLHMAFYIIILQFVQ